MQLFMLAYNLGNFLRRLTRPKVVKGWSLQGVPLRLIKTGARLVRHARRLVFQMAEVTESRDVWMAIQERIGGLRLVPG
jgi:Transposase DDE domain group 1